MKVIRHKGFTLIELMIVVALVAILASIAYPSFQEQVRKSKRSDASGALEGLANVMERQFTADGTYSDVIGAGLYASRSPVDTQTAAAYNLTVPTVTATTYTLLATRTGSQATDRCGDLRLQHTGAKQIINQHAGVTADDCWY